MNGMVKGELENSDVLQIRIAGTTISSYQSSMPKMDKNPPKVFIVFLHTVIQLFDVALI